uniref:NADH dehydrogenase subunit 6 n=1 Tax=Ditylenchus dipsaci TaxID=166011 RepID=A0A915DQR2_9BILA
MFSVISQTGTISCFIVLATIPFTSAYLPIWVFQAAYTIMNLFGSLAFVGVIKSTMMISSQFSHVLMAATVIISSTIILLLPLGINVFAPDNTATEWSRIFIALPCIQIVTISIFYLLVTRSLDLGPILKKSRRRKCRQKLI